MIHAAAVRSIHLQPARIFVIQSALHCVDCFFFKQWANISQGPSPYQLSPNTISWLGGGAGSFCFSFSRLLSRQTERASMRVRRF